MANIVYDFMVYSRTNSIFQNKIANYPTKPNIKTSKI